MPSPDIIRSVTFLKGLVFKDADVEQAILSSPNQPVYFVFTYSRYQRECKCNEEHEMFQYIRNDDDNDEIDTVMFEKICKAVEVGRCPHVAIVTESDPYWNAGLESEHTSLTPRDGNLIPRDDTTMGFPPDCNQVSVLHPHSYQNEADDDVEVSRTTMLHAAAAVGNRAVVSHLLNRSEELQLYFNMYSSDFYMYPWKIAVLHQRTALLPLLLLNIVRSMDTPCRPFLSGPAPHEHGLFLVEHNCPDGLAFLLTSIDNARHPVFSRLVTAAVLYNRPRILAVLSDHFNINSEILISEVPDFRVTSFQLAALLGYHESSYEIQMRGNRDSNHALELDSRSVVHIIVWILNLHEYLHLTGSALVANTLKRISAIASVTLDVSSRRKLLEKITPLCNADAKVLSIIFDQLGCDIDTQLFIRVRGPTTFLCEMLMYYMDFTFTALRHNVKTLLQCNPNSNMNASAIMRCAWKIDMCWEFSTFRFDAEMYQIMKQHDEEMSDVQPLTRVLSATRFNEMTFYVPLLFEHGFNSRSAIAKPASHPLLRLVYRALLSTPRSLKSGARVTLRRACPGQMIHAFVNQTTLPATIKEYILMTKELNQFCAA